VDIPNQRGKMKYQHGDIFGVPSDSFLGIANKAVFSPHTDLYHFGIIADYIYDEEDYVILESSAKGISVGRLSWYQTYRVFRFADPEIATLGVKACQKLTMYGRARYDYALFLKIFIGCLTVWLGQILTGHKPTAIKPVQLPYGVNSRFICTEAANLAWKIVGYPIIPKDTIPLPAGFIKALNNGLLVEI